MRRQASRPSVVPTVGPEQTIHLDREEVVGLTDAISVDPTLTGAKGAALARAAAGGLPVLPGFVITTQAAAEIGARGDLSDLRPGLYSAIYDAWEGLSRGGSRSLVVRSSSTSEDGASSSMAGMFMSVLDVRGWEAFSDAVMTVLGSAGVISLDGTRSDAPMAVLVQPFLMASRGGILFGVDPVTGNSEHLTVVAIEGGPDALVSGREEGIHHLLDHSGKLVSRVNGTPRLLNRSDRRALARLSQRARTYFGGPQDIEWAIDPAGRLFLLQSRPVTAIAATATGPVLGPGPVAETFPDPLAPLERDLWVTPLEEAVRHGLLVAGAATKGRVARSPVVTTVGGRVAADLVLFGIKTGPKSLFARLDPREPARRMLAAWRVGRLKAALPGIAGTVVQRVDRELESVPDAAEMTNEQLLNVLKRSRRFLSGLYGYEVLAGLLTEPNQDAATGAEIALQILILGRKEGFSDEEIMARRPEVMSLTPPAITGGRDLPATPALPPVAVRSLEDLGPREALRLRIRWVQELSARAAWELGRRMIPAGALSDASLTRLLTLEELESMVAGGPPPADLPARFLPETPPLPATFRLATDGTPVPLQSKRNGSGARGAGGGRGIGRVHQGSAPAPGDILVVSILDPSLAPLLPGLGGLVAETGNVLSHLAILAREFGVPTVVGVEDARARFEEGSVVVVDGTTGEVSEVTEA